MKNLLLLLAAAALLGGSLACTGSSSSGGSLLAPPPSTTTDFSTFVKQQVVTHPENTQPVDISTTTFSGTDNMDPTAFNSVLPPAAPSNHGEAAP
jgi:hypothetical protein